MYSIVLAHHPMIALLRLQSQSISLIRYRCSKKFLNMFKNLEKKRRIIPKNLEKSTKKLNNQEMQSIQNVFLKAALFISKRQRVLRALPHQTNWQTYFHDVSVLDMKRKNALWKWDSAENKKAKKRMHFFGKIFLLETIVETSFPIFQTCFSHFLCNRDYIPKPTFPPSMLVKPTYVAI